MPCTNGRESRKNFLISITTVALWKCTLGTSGANRHRVLRLSRAGLGSARRLARPPVLVFAWRRLGGSAIYDAVASRRHRGICEVPLATPVPKSQLPHTPKAPNTH